MANLYKDFKTNKNRKQRISLTNFFEQKMVMVITEFIVSGIYYLRISLVRLDYIKIYNYNISLRVDEQL